MTLAQLRKRHQKLKRSLLALGPTIQGTILQRVIERPDPQCPQQTKTYGPYYQWTRKLQGRTVIQNLSPSQAKAFQRAIRENQTLEKTLDQIRAISLKVLELTTEGVKKRAPRRTKNKPLS